MVLTMSAKSLALSGAWRGSSTYAIWVLCGDAPVLLRGAPLRGPRPRLERAPSSKASGSGPQCNASWPPPRRRAPRRHESPTRVPQRPNASSRFTLDKPELLSHSSVFSISKRTVRIKASTSPHCTWPTALCHRGCQAGACLANMVLMTTPTTGTRGAMGRCAMIPRDLLLGKQTPH